MSIHGSTFGNLTRDAELKQAGSSQVVKFSVASNRKVKGEKQVTFVNCSWFGKRAETVVQYLRKGSRVVVHGELSQREHNGKTYLECDVSAVDLAGDHRDSQAEQSQPAPSGGGGFSDAEYGVNSEPDQFPF